MGLPLLIGLLIAAAAQPPAPPQPQPTVQQQFDAATAALDAGNWPEALRQFEALEGLTDNPRTLAIVRIRKAAVLVELGRIEDAAAALRLALPVLPAADPSLRADRFEGLMTLGRIAEHDLDYPEALRQYRAAAAIEVAEADRLLVQRGIIQTQLFTNAEGAVRDADAALRLAASAAPGNRSLEGQFHTLKGRALLNLGRFDAAEAELETALRLLGNITMRVDRADLLARSDLAIAALLTGDLTNARRYLAYTGAGRFPRGQIRALAGNAPPPCGPDIAPADVAVIELFIGADGSVANVTPIYASRQGPAAIAFSRAVTGWAFDPDDARGIPALFRSVVRLEVRCSLEPAPGRHSADPHAELRGLAAADPAWERQLAARANRSAAALRRDLAALGPDGGQPPREALPLLILIANHASAPRAEREAALRRALPMAAELGVSPRLVASIAIAIGREQLAQREPRERSDGIDFDPLLDLPQVRASGEVAAFVRLAQARRLYRRGDYDEALALATGIGALPEARAGQPLHFEALEIQVAVHAAQGDVMRARAAHDAMGPGAARCGLAPRRRRLNATDRDFPNDAALWAFEGWASVEYAIAPDGTVPATRIVTAYPPFVFGESAARVMGRARFEPIYVPDGAPCVMDRETVRFLLPSY